MAESTNNYEGSRALPVFSFSTDGGSTYTPVAELRDSDLGDPSTESLDSTNTDITNGAMTFTYGWTDYGTATFTTLHREDSIVAVEALLRQDLDWKVSYLDPDHITTDSAYTFGGFITTGPSLPMPVQGSLWESAVSIKVSGIRTFTVGT